MCVMRLCFLFVLLCGSIQNEDRPVLQSRQYVINRRRRRLASSGVRYNKLLLFQFFGIKKSSLLKSMQENSN